MSITPGHKAEVLNRLTRARICGLNVSVMRAILYRINPQQGVAFCWFREYGKDCSRSERTVQRTIQVACARGFLLRAYREGAPVLWCPQLMDMEPVEAVKRANTLSAQHFGRQQDAIANLAKLASPPSDAPPPHLELGPRDRAEVPAFPPIVASSLAPISASNLAPELTQSKSPVSGRFQKAVNSRPTPKPPRAYATHQAHELARRLARLCGHGESYNWPEAWRLHAPRIVQGWLDAGWPVDVIVGTVHAVRARYSSAGNESVRYFERPIGRAIAALNESSFTQQKIEQGGRR
jgi:hypothetical protein